MSPRARRGLLIGAGVAVALLLAAPLLVLVAADHGAADGLIAQGVSSKLKRPVRFAHARTRLLGADPTVVLEDVVISSPREITPFDLLHARTVTLHLRGGALLLGRIDLRAIAIDHAELRLVRLGHDRNNYTFGKGGTGGLLQRVESLSLSAARLRMDDPDRHVFLSGTVAHDGRPGLPRPLAFAAEGKIDDGPVVIHARGGPLNGRPSTAPWSIDATIEDGRTHVALSGAAQKPFDFRGFDLDVRGEGPNLAALGYLFGVATPNSRPFALDGHAHRAGRRVELTRLHARLGESDVAGTVVSDHDQPRKRMTAALTAGTLQSADIAALFSPAPSHLVARDTPGQGAAKGGEAVSQTKPFPVEGLRKLDGGLDLVAAHLRGYALPMDDVRLKARLERGRLTLSPLSFALPSGRVAASATLDAAPATPTLAVNASLRGARLGALQPKMRATVDGPLDGWIDLHGAGANVKAILRDTGGKAAFRVGAGTLARTPSAILSGDLVAAVGLVLGDKAKRAPLACAVGEFSAAHGRLNAERLVIVTGSGVAHGAGGIDIADGTVSLRLQGRPTRRQLLHVDAPVTVEGPLAHPRVSVDKGRLATQGVIAGALAVVATPLAAMLPFAGKSGEAVDCGALLAGAAGYTSHR